MNHKARTAACVVVGFFAGLAYAGCESTGGKGGADRDAARNADAVVDVDAAAAPEAAPAPDVAPAADAVVDAETDAGAGTGADGGSGSQVVSGVYAGGPVYYSTDWSIAELRGSGFTHVIVWTIHINEHGDLDFNAEFPIVKAGKYVGDDKYPEFPDNIARLKTPPTSIRRIEFGLSAARSPTFLHIKTLVSAQGTGPNSTLYKNFEALKKRIPGIDAINFDDEMTYDATSATQFAVMLADLGYKVALVPYTAHRFWSDLARDTNAARPGTVDMVYLQCYAGGTGNNPGLWASYFKGIPVYPGLWSRFHSPARVEAQMARWHKDFGISGGFMWIYDDFDNSPKVAQYASAITNALSN